MRGGDEMGRVPPWSGCLTCKAGLGACDLSIAGRPFAEGGTQEKVLPVAGRRPRHPQAWISDKECLSRGEGVRIRFVGLFSSFLNSLFSGQVAPSCRGLPPPFIGTEVSVCVCVHVSSPSSASLHHKAVTQGQHCVWGITFCAGLQLCVSWCRCVCVGYKKVGSIGGLRGTQEVQLHVQKKVTVHHVLVRFVSLSSVKGFSIK